MLANTSIEDSPAFGANPHRKRSYSHRYRDRTRLVYQVEYCPRQHLDPTFPVRLSPLRQQNHGGAGQGVRIAIVPSSWTLSAPSDKPRLAARRSIRFLSHLQHLYTPMTMAKILATEPTIAKRTTAQSGREAIVKAKYTCEGREDRNAEEGKEDNHYSRR